MLHRLPGRPPGNEIPKSVRREKDPVVGWSEGSSWVGGLAYYKYCILG